MIVVEQPFRRGRYGALLVGDPGDLAIGIEQDALVVLQAGRERPAGSRRGGDGLVGSEAFGVLLQPLDTEEFADLNPSAENIAIVIYNILRNQLSEGLDLKIRLYETERNFVEYPVY